jgi:uncharacterized protein with HEPN domain
MRDDSERLRDILKAIDQILAKTSQGRAAFDSDEMLQVWVLHYLQIVGEASRCLSQQFRQRHPDRVWSKAAGMRHILVHHYFEIDADQIWKVVENDLPELRRRVIELLAEEAGV